MLITRERFDIGGSVVPCWNRADKGYPMVKSRSL